MERTLSLVRLPSRASYSCSRRAPVKQAAKHTDSCQTLSLTNVRSVHNDVIFAPSFSFMTCNSQMPIDSNFF